VISSSPRRSFLPALWLLVGLNIALVVARGIWHADYVPRLVQGDTLSYATAARNLLAGHGFSVCEQPPYIPDNFRTPLYPALLAALYLVAGAQPWLMIVVQCLLSLLTLWLFVRATDVGFGADVAQLGAYVWALSPLLLTCIHSLITETAFLTLFVASWWCWLLFVMRRRWGALVCAGVLLGLATLCRPAIQYVPLILAPLSALAAWRAAHSWRKTLAAGLLLLVMFGVVVAPWMARNQRALGTWKLSTADGCHYFSQSAILTLRAQFGHAADVTRGGLYNVFFTHYTVSVTQEPYMATYWNFPLAACDDPALLAGVRAALGPVPAGGPIGLSNYVAVSRAQLHAAVAIIMQYPAAYARCVARSTAQLLLMPPWQEVMRLVYPSFDAYAFAQAMAQRDWNHINAMPRTPVVFGIISAVITTAFSVGAIGFALIGFVLMLRGKADICVKLACVLLPAYFMAVTGGYGEARYRVAMLPVLFALTAQGLCWLRSRCSRT